MTRRHLAAHATRPLRLAMIVHLLLAVCLGQSHLLHLGAAAPDQCRDACQRHMAPESADHGDPIACGACAWAAHLGQDAQPEPPLAAVPPPVPAAPRPDRAPRPVPALRATSPRAPPLA